MATKPRKSLEYGIRAPVKPRKKLTILDYARMASLSEGTRYVSPMWESTLKAIYALPLNDNDIDNLVLAGKRSREYWIGRRGGAGTANHRGVPVKQFREFWARVGRRGEKTSTCSLICLYEAREGGHEQYMIPGERGLVNVISTGKKAAGKTAEFMALYAGALGLEVEVEIDGVTQSRTLSIPDTDVAVLVSPTKASGARGYATPVIVLDEFAHLNANVDAVNTDKSVLTAVKPALRQFATSKLIAISSPLGATGVFHDNVERFLVENTEDPDDTDYGLAVEGPSWLWGSNVTEEDAKRDMPDEEERNQEYGAIPSGVDLVAFPAGDVTEAFKSRKGTWLWGRPFLVIDSADGGGNTFAVLVARFGRAKRELVPLRDVTPDGTSILRRGPDGAILYEPASDLDVLALTTSFGFSGKEIRELGMGLVVQRIADTAKVYGARYIFGDQYGAGFLVPLFAPHNLEFRRFAASNGSKHEAVQTLRWLLRDKRVVATASGPLVHKDLKEYRKRISGGRYVYGNPSTDKHHNDYASAFVTLGHALNGISLNSESRGTIGKDGTGAEYQIEYALTRVGVGKQELGPGSAWGGPAQAP